MLGFYGAEVWQFLPEEHRSQRMAELSGAQCTHYNAHVPARLPRLLCCAVLRMRAAPCRLASPAEIGALAARSLHQHAGYLQKSFKAKAECDDLTRENSRALFRTMLGERHRAWRAAPSVLVCAPQLTGCPPLAGSAVSVVSLIGDGLCSEEFVTHSLAGAELSQVRAHAGGRLPLQRAEMQGVVCTC